MDIGRTFTDLCAHDAATGAIWTLKELSRPDAPGAMLALSATAGFTDVLELARLRMPDAYSLFGERAAPRVTKECALRIGGRMLADGRELEPVDVASVAVARAKGCAGVVICLLHAWRNPAH